MDRGQDNLDLDLDLNLNFEPLPLARLKSPDDRRYDHHTWLPRWVIDPISDPHYPFFALQCLPN